MQISPLTTENGSCAQSNTQKAEVKANLSEKIVQDCEDSEGATTKIILQQDKKNIQHSYIQKKKSPKI